MNLLQKLTEGAEKPKMIRRLISKACCRQAAMLLNGAAPEGESLAYINAEEAQMLHGAGYGSQDRRQLVGHTIVFPATTLWRGRKPLPWLQFGHRQIGQGLRFCNGRSEFAKTNARGPSRVRPGIPRLANELHVIERNRRPDGQLDRISGYASTRLWIDDGPATVKRTRIFKC